MLYRREDDNNLEQSVVSEMNENELDFGRIVEAELRGSGRRSTISEGS